MKKKPVFQKFEVPESFLDTLYEMTGGMDKNKGFFLCYIDEDGEARLRHKFDSQATDFAVNKAVEIFLQQEFDQSEISISNGRNCEDDDDDED